MAYWTKTSLLTMLVIITVLTQCITKPLIGPCVGMNCLHGILMHNDDTQGESHAAEDNYERMKDTLMTGPKQKLGPCQGEDCLHEMMHSEDIGEIRHPNQGASGPELEMQMVLPQDPESQYHGVMMHGDSTSGHNHNAEHEENANSAAEHNRQEDKHIPHYHSKNIIVGPDTEALHGILMHGDAEIGIDHTEEDALKFGNFVANDEHDKKNKLGDRLDAGGMMHDEGRVELSEEEEEDQGENTGQSLPFITDSLLSEIDEMKARYLAENNPNDNRREDMTGNDLGYTDGEGTEGDMRHDLGLIGNSGPIKDVKHVHH